MPGPEAVLVYPPELPISGIREQIARTLADHQVVVVAGATGSGKTTQLPKICLESGRRSIAHTQPRRIAARSIAERIAEELQVPVGGLVGYRVRFTDAVSADTRIALMTDGILLNDIHRDRLLRRYDTIIIDEAHERSLNVDFLLGYLRRILPRRPDLRVIVTSATIDPAGFARHFADAEGDPAPVIEVPGRAFPVEVRYRPRPEDDGDSDDVSAIVAALRELDGAAPGDVLVFLPGEAEIRDAADAVRAAYPPATGTEILALFGRLTAAEQHRVFAPKGPAVRRRVVLATNVAETSLTVPGVRHVIDTGTARISRYSARSKVQRLPIEPVSQASAQQRAGRAGRTGPGIAIRLYAQDDLERRPEFTDPEVLRTSLAAVVLHLLALGFGDIGAFPFLTPPDSRGVAAARDLLVELGAVARGEGALKLTAIGRDMARMPVDPRFARMLVAARTGGVLEPVLAIVAGLSIPDVRERPADRAEEADRLHARFTDPTSDFLTLLNLWNHLRHQQRTLSSSAFRRMCRSELLNYVRVREWFDVHRQVARMMHHRISDQDADAAADPDAVHRALLAGLLSHIGVLDERRTAGAREGGRPPRAEYRGARGARFQVFPGSALRRGRARAVMAAELIETSRLYAHTVAVIDPAWAESLAGDLVHRELTEPRWSKDRGSAVVTEKVTLFGVELVTGRTAQLARFDPERARELFIRHALVAGEADWTGLGARRGGFLRRNADLRERLEGVEQRIRRREVVADDDTVAGFYRRLIPQDVRDLRSFAAWWRTASQTDPGMLDMAEDDLRATGVTAPEHEFPAHWQQGDQVLSLRYRFDPGDPGDGVTAIVPISLLPQLHPDGFDWQVPGLRRERVTALLRSLPKALRRHVVPAADWAERITAELEGSGPEDHGGLPKSGLADAVAARVQAAAGRPVAASDFDLERIPEHLRIAFEVVDDAGEVLDSGRDLATVQERLRDAARASVTRAVADAAGGRPTQPSGFPAGTGPDQPGGFALSSGLQAWTFGELPKTVETAVAGGVVRGYPAIVDRGASVALTVEPDAQRAAALTRAGIRRLLLLAVPSPAPWMLDHLTQQERLALAGAPYPDARAVVEDVRVALADAAVAAAGTVRDPAAFERLRDGFSAAIVDDLTRTTTLVVRILQAARDLDRELAARTSLALLAPLADVRAQRDALVFAGFVSRTGPERLAHLPRYLAAATERIRALPDQPGRDRQRMTEFDAAAARYRDAGGVLPLRGDEPAALAHARWLLEEFRVSLFAQRLGTAEPVSLQRIAAAVRTTRQ